MAEISERNSISLECCAPIPDISAKHKKMTDTLIDNGTELGYSTKLFNNININMPQVSF